MGFPVILVLNSLSDGALEANQEGLFFNPGNAISPISES